jgi:hypothetical protein
LIIIGPLIQGTKNALPPSLLSCVVTKKEVSLYGLDGGRLVVFLGNEKSKCNGFQEEEREAREPLAKTDLSRDVKVCMYQDLARLTSTEMLRYVSIPRQY